MRRKRGLCCSMYYICAVVAHTWRSTRAGELSQPTQLAWPNKVERPAGEKGRMMRGRQRLQGRQKISEAAEQPGRGACELERTLAVLLVLVLALQWWWWRRRRRRWFEREAGENAQVSACTRGTSANRRQVRGGQQATPRGGRRKRRVVLFRSFPLPFFPYLEPVITKGEVCVDDRNDRTAELPRAQQR
jgi:hypothetical protein